MYRSSLRNVLMPLVASLALAAAPAVSAAGSASEQPTMGEMLVDGVVVRPLGLGATVVGIATWIVTLPFSALGGNVGEATQTLIVDPAAFTFTRPLGEL
jgi:hypothetical protein